MGLTWHSYVPWSRRWTNLICSVHVFEPGVCNIANRSSFVYICAPEDRMCQSLRRIHEIWFCAKIKVMLNKIYELFINSCADKLRRIKFLNYVETKLGYYTYCRATGHISRRTNYQFIVGHLLTASKQILSFLNSANLWPFLDLLRRYYCKVFGFY